MCFLLPTLGYEVGCSHDCVKEWGCKCVAAVFSFVLLCVQTFKIFFCLNFLECMDLMSSCGQDRWQMLWLI